MKSAISTGRPAPSLSRPRPKIQVFFQEGCPRRLRAGTLMHDSYWQFLSTTLLKKNLNFQGAYRKYSSFFSRGLKYNLARAFPGGPLFPKRDPPGKRNSPSQIFSDFLHSPSSPLPVLPSALGAFTSLEHNLPPSLKNLIFLGRLPKIFKLFFKRVVSNHDNTLCL